MDNSKKYNIGLDIGIGSVGWAVLDEDFKVLDKGVRLFDSGSTKNNQERRKCRAARRLKSRRRVRLDSFIKLAVQEQMIDNLGNFEDNKQNFIDQIKNLDTLSIRNEAINNEVSKIELLTALYKILKHRGFTYLSEEDFKNMERKEKAIPCIEQLKFLKQNYYYRGWEEDPSKTDTQNKKIKKENFNNRNFSLHNYIDEVELIFIANNKLFNGEFEKKYWELLKKTRAFWEGPGSIKSPTKYGLFQLNEKTGKVEQKFINKLNTKTGEVEKHIITKLYETTIGKCSIYPDQLRSPKHSFSAELFNLLNDLNNIYFSVSDNKFSKSEKIKLSSEDKQNLLKMIFKINVSKNDNITISNITENMLIKYFTKKIDKTDLPHYKLRGFRINTENKFQITQLEGYKEIVKALYMIKAIKKDFNPLLDLNTEFLDDMAYVLNNFDSPDLRIAKLELTYSNKYKNFFKSKSDIESFITKIKWSGKSGTHSLSIAALREFKNDLLTGEDNFQQLKSRKGKEIDEPRYEFIKNKDIKYIPLNKDNNFLNYYTDFMPYSVIVSFRETIKVINALWKQWGVNNINNIVVELAREKNDKEQKENIRKFQASNKKKNDKIEELLNSIPGHHSGKLRRKLYLYLEQEGKDIYDGKSINIDAIKHNYEIDHIIPQSISFDNSNNNVVLTSKWNNQSKSNKTPFMWIKDGGNSSFKTWDAFKDNVDKIYDVLKKNYKRDSKKKAKQLKALNIKINNLKFEEDINKHDTQLEFINRNLVDTRWTTKKIMNLLQDFIKTKEYPTKVKNLNGKMTRFMRNKLQFYKSDDLKKNRDLFKHHAIDAAVIVFAALQNKTINSLMNEVAVFNDILFNKETGEVVTLDNDNKNFINMKYRINFCNSIKSDSTPTKFSRKAKIKRNIPLTIQTVYSSIMINGKRFKVSKLNIYNTKSEEIEKLKNYFGSNPKNKDWLLMLQPTHQNLKVYNQLNKIYKSSLEEIEELGKKNKIKNPFLFYCKKYNKDNSNYINRENDKNIKNPIKKIKKIDKGPIPIDNPNNINVNKLGFLTSLNFARIDVYEDTGLGKIHLLRIDAKNTTFPINDIKEHINSFKKKMNEKNITYKFSINHSDIFMNRKTEDLFYISGFNDKDGIVYKPLKFSISNKKTKIDLLNEFNFLGNAPFSATGGLKTKNFNKFFKENQKVRLDILGNIKYKY